MRHYHALSNMGKTIDMALVPPVDNPYRECNRDFSWVGADGKWYGDPYNHDGMCIKACRRDLEAPKQTVEA